MWLPVRLAAFSAFGLSIVDTKSVFAHYMVQAIDRSTDHAYQDIQSAITVGFDAFAMNVGSNEDWVADTASQRF
ncbi:hypothetical protein N7527_001800 [Penicillium freii]|nr:hypothetical protein N7527_001800 [Penicillium freii]